MAAPTLPSLMANFLLTTVALGFRTHMHDALSCLVRAFPFLLKIYSRKAGGGGGGGWTFEENKRFENALAIFSLNEDDSSATFDGFPERAAPFFPGKSVEQIRLHLEALMHDLDLIESGEIPFPEQWTIDEEDEGKRKREDGDAGSSGSSLSLPLLSSSSADRRHIWTREEHERFLRGMNIYGKGDWKRISANVVFTKTPSELASHSQEHFSRRDRPTSPKRPRIIYDVHDDDEP
ncbi:transcription factor SRM1 [Eucalyptus grandis]|uniref:transcription factor SRM1 n=1 Tax=Eucalyptus grandis TaxID=71139 RepID=UPI00192EB57D|nr:transcription factor SRM1 [Eucalyptus grandis]